MASQVMQALWMLGLLLGAGCGGAARDQTPLTVTSASAQMRATNPRGARMRALAFVSRLAPASEDARVALVESLCHGILVDPWRPAMQEIRKLGPVMTQTLLQCAEKAEFQPWVSRFSVMALRESEAFGDEVAARLHALRTHMRSSAPGIADGTRIGDEVDNYFAARGR